MNITTQELKDLLNRAWELGAAAAKAGVDEPVLQDTEVEFLIDTVSP